MYSCFFGKLFDLNIRKRELATTKHLHTLVSRFFGENLIDQINVTKGIFFVGN